jgi:predicted metal-dependent HD superfamily phosphohydrolase
MIAVLLHRMRCASCQYEQIVDDHSWDERVPEAIVRADHVLPSERFAELWRAFGAQGPWAGTFEQLRDAYGEPHRAYHTAAHLGACLRKLDEPDVRALAGNLANVEAALWFHDAVYDTHAHDNEEASARLAEMCLGKASVDPARVAKIAAYVRATKSHETADPDGHLVLDIDLSILGEAPGVFAGFEAEIQREYAWVPAAAYAVGRGAVLRGFLARPQIYATPLFRDRYEANARRNIAASLEQLAV